MTSLLGALRWLGGRERAGLAGPLKFGERGLGLATRLSPTKFETVEICWSREDEGLRTCETCDFFSATGADGLLKVSPRKCSLTGVNKEDLLRGEGSISNGTLLSGPCLPTLRCSGLEDELVAGVPEGLGGSPGVIAFVSATEGSCRGRIFLRNRPNLGEV